MKLKSLIKKFSYNELLKTCKRENWRIPTAKEVKNRKTEHDTFWIIDPPEKQDRKTHAHIYQKHFKDGLQIANKHFLMNAVVIVEEKVCEWKDEEESFFDGYWHTSCGNDFSISNSDTPNENGFKFCCYCGKTLKETK